MAQDQVLQNALGTVISSLEGPSTRRFSFVLDKDKTVRRNQFVQLKSEDGKLIGRISDIFKTNRYFFRPESVKEYQNSGQSMNEIFPVSDWEFLVADVDSIGVYDKKGFKQSLIPPSPGTPVHEPEKKILECFFGLDPLGINIGSLPHHKVPVKINFTRLLQKHLAILAMSGAGKSYLTSVLLEEVLSRKQEKGTISTVVLDTHGEYTSFASDPEYSSKTMVFRGSEIRIGIPNISSYELSRYMSKPSVAAKMALSRIMRGSKTQKTGLSGIMNEIESSSDIKSNVKIPLLSELDDLKRTGLFGGSDYPPLEEISRQGGISILDLSDIVSNKKKQIIASYLCRKLFNARRNGIIPPMLLVVEEAHQLVPQGVSKEVALARGIIETIAREGRKFHFSLCLISQRPIQLSTTILSQCNTNIILRVTNPYDLKHIGESSEGINRAVQDSISTLPVGTGLLVGEAVNYPLFVDVRKRNSKESEKGMPLEQAAKEYSKIVLQKQKDADSFM